ncbi:lysylphosphatidylglycerol synthase domain-containing protein [Marinobacter alexandrii]|uniref:lysylphosphatidylglycerol synthase domain-containing protein n=1 Tax=Marinobacter alexandrii TaxID=2570351 RepID=UPI003298A59D
MIKQKMRRPILTIASIMIALLTVWLWLRIFEVTTEDVNSLLAGMRWAWLPVTFVFLAAHVGLSAWKWSDIEVSLGGTRPSLRTAFASGAFAMGLGTFLPAPLINVACRSLANKFSGSSTSRGAVSGTLDQFSDFFVFAWFAIPAALALLHNDARIYLWGAPGAFLAGFAVIFLLSAMQPLLQRYWPFARKDWIATLLDKGLLARIYSIATLRLINLTLITVTVHLASGAATISSLLVSVPIVTVAISVAMLPGAIGVAEWSFSAVLALQGIVTDSVVNFVLANRLILTALPLILAFAVLLFLIASKGKKKPIQASGNGGSAGANQLSGK